MMDLTDAEVKLYKKDALKAAFEKYGVRCGCLNVYIPALGNETRVKKKLMEDLALAKELNIDKLMVIPMLQTDFIFAKRLTSDEIFSRIVGFLRMAVAKGEKFGITVCIENTSCCNVPLCSAEDCVKLLQTVPNLKIVFDIANMTAKDDDPFAFYEAIKDHICHVHLKDARFTERKSGDVCKNGKYLQCCLWGEGEVPVKSIFDRLRADGYAGVYAMEYVAPAIEGRIPAYLQLDCFLTYLFR